MAYVSAVGIQMRSLSSQKLVVQWGSGQKPYRYNCAALLNCCHRDRSHFTLEDLPGNQGVTQRKRRTSVYWTATWDQAIYIQLRILS